MFDPKADLRAAVLTGAIVTAPVDPTPFAYRRGPAIYVRVEGAGGPLNLDGERLVYRIPAAGPPQSSLCRCTTHLRRHRS